MNEGFDRAVDIRPEAVRSSFYLFGSRIFTHVVFWLAYYLAFSLIWATPEHGLLASFFLEFVLLPPRMLAVYATIYFLMPAYLLQRRLLKFLLGYAAIIVAAALIQRLSGFFFYEQLFIGGEGELITFGGLLRSVVLVNTTVISVTAVKLLQHYYVAVAEAGAGEAAQQQVAVRADRRTHMIDPDEILYIEGMGNYVTYILKDGEKLVVYGSIKSALAVLPDQFFRLHRSYILNRRHLQSFNAENVIVGGHVLPRGKDVPDALLLGEEEQQATI